MIINEIKLKNFRNYSNLSVKLNPHINIFYGNNAQGKTNLLESIYVLGLTKSHLLNIDYNLIKDNESTYKIVGTITKNNIKKKLEIINNNNNNKILKVDNKEIKKISDYINNSLNIIIFYPEDLDIIKGSPNIRRNYMNLELSQLSDNYLKILSEYNKLLKIRNDYLKKIKKEEYVDKTYFQIITNYLVDKAELIYKMRKKFISKINENCEKIYEEITKIKGFSIKYLCNFEIGDDYKQDLSKKLKSNYNKELKFGATLYGPHRDELEFFINDKNLKQYGSQGQKRLAVLAMKLSEIDIFKKYKNTNPIILLDDVFSELDDIKKKNIIKYIDDDIQVIITTTELSKINKFNLSTIYKIKDGNIIQIKEVDKNGRK